MVNKKVVRCETWDQVQAAIAELNAQGIRCYLETKKVGHEVHLIALTSTGFSAGFEVHMPLTLVQPEIPEGKIPATRVPDFDQAG